MKNKYKHIEFDTPSHQNKFYTKKKSYIPTDLKNVLLDPKKCNSVQPSPNKIYIGDASFDPDKSERYPFYIDPDILSSHVLVGGSIGSGKTSLVFRIIAGAINQSRSVIVSEAKSGKMGGEDGAAYTNLGRYLSTIFSNIKIYRWPRGNCFFNPLIYLETDQQIRIFFDFIKDQILSEEKLNGDMVPFVGKAIEIAKAIFEFMRLLPNSAENLTIRKLLFYLKNVDEFKKDYCEFAREILKKEPKEKYYDLTDKLYEIETFLTRYKYFKMYKDDQMYATPFGVSLLIRQLEDKDLLYFSEHHSELVELSIEDILYHQSLIILSQPLYDPASSVIGPLFWDCVLSKVLELGPKACADKYDTRLKVLAVLDESHRLSVGKMGSSGDFLRQYDLAVIEVTPSIIDFVRWNNNRHVYQTIISLSPGVPNVVELISTRLPNYRQSPLVGDIQYRDNNPALGFKMRTDYKLDLAQDEAGVSLRSLSNSGRFTALIQSFNLDSSRKLFWVELESPLLGNIEYLLDEYLNLSTDHQDRLKLNKIIDYTLGIDSIFDDDL